jgi:alpha-glucosidase
MAMMALYEAPLQMLCDSPTNYEKNEECLKFMAAIPVVWDDTKAMEGAGPDTMAGCLRKAKDGAWYAAAINDSRERNYSLNTQFLGDGVWEMELFADDVSEGSVPSKYVRALRRVEKGELVNIRLAAGGGFIAKFVKKTK